MSASSPVMKQKIAEADRVRDTLLAQMTDAELYRKAVESQTAIWLSAEEKTRRSEAWQRRNSRRTWENSLRRGGYIPPGPWDDDLDRYHGNDEFEFSLGDGYMGHVRRNKYSSWNGYVKLPEGHVAIGISYDAFQYYRPHDVPLAPLDITFSRGNMFGFDHTHYHDCWPFSYYSPLDYNEDGTRRNGMGKYLTFEEVKAECQELADYFKMIAREHADKYRGMSKSDDDM